VIRLPARAKPEAQDFIAVVKSSKNQAAAQNFVQTVLSPTARRSSGPPASANLDPNRRQGASNDSQSDWMPRLARLALILTSAATFAVVLGFLLLPIVA